MHLQTVQAQTPGTKTMEATPLSYLQLINTGRMSYTRATQILELEFGRIGKEFQAALEAMRHRNKNGSDAAGFHLANIHRLLCCGRSEEHTSELQSLRH